MLLTNRRLWSMPLLTGLALAVATNAQAGPGPIGTYYITDSNNPVTGAATLDGIKGSSYNSNANYSAFESPIAVFAGPNVVRTTGDQGTRTGGEYTGVDSLTVIKDGTTYTNNGFGLGPFNHFFFDGTTNGVNNFAVEYGNNGAVVATDTSWGGLSTVLFTTGIGNDYGITYDKWNDSLWIQNYGTGNVTDYSMAGTILSSFGGVHDGGAKTALAMDIDRTLWFANLARPGTLDHYDVNGNFLGTASYTGLGVAHGGEIAQDFNTSAVPEPGSIFSAALGGLITLGWLGRCRSRA
jgi:hypothetical protein